MYLKPSTVAKMLDCHKSSIIRYIKNGWLSGKKMKSGHWRVKEESVYKMMLTDTVAEKILSSVRKP